MKSSSFWTRRDVLTAAVGGTTAAFTGVVPRSVAALAPYNALSHNMTLPAGTVDPSIIIDETDVRALTQRALDAAKSAGATYADVRVTRVLRQGFEGGGAVEEAPFKGEQEELAVGVRAFVKGGWGFAASPYWDSEEVVELARNAVVQAKGNAPYAVAPVEWTRIPVASGSWKTPIKIDPFIVSLEEKNELLSGWHKLKARYETQEDRAGFLQSYSAKFFREERAIATSDGAYFTQVLYTSGGSFTLRPTQPGNVVIPVTAAGWELFREGDLPGRIRALYDDGNARIGVGSAKPGEVGRYDVVFDGETMAVLLEATLGVATQLDRALGYEANAAGTSFLGPDPLALLGSFQTASPVVTVTADRTMPRGLATVKWDDEGVEPELFTLIKDGILVDYQTTREQAMWLAPYYQKHGMPIRSHGCAAAQNALAITMQHTPNLVLQPGKTDATFETLIAGTQRGLAVMGGTVGVDFQARNGMGSGVIREIVNGRLGAVVNGLVFLFNAQQLWKNVTALGGAKSAVSVAGESGKGQPWQSTQHTVQAVPAKILNVDFVTMSSVRGRA